MLKKIKEVPIIKNGTPFEIHLNSDLESKVEKNWEEFLEKHEGYWDGELLSVTQFDVATNILEISKARYSWLIYSKNHNDLDIRSLFVAILFQTLDDKYVVIKNNHDKVNIILTCKNPNEQIVKKFNSLKYRKKLLLIQNTQENNYEEFDFYKWVW